MSQHPDPERVVMLMQRLAQQKRHYKQWAYDLRDREKRGEELSEVQQSAWRAALTYGEAEPMAGHFNPIDPEKLPPGMRPAVDPHLALMEGSA